MGRDYSLGTTAIGWLAIVLALVAAFRTWLAHKVEDRLAEVWEERSPELVERLEKSSWTKRSWVAKLRDHLDRITRPTDARAAWLVTLPALAIAIGYTAWRFSGGVGASVVAVALAAAAVAIAAHELGHLIAAWLLSARVKHAYWRSGVVLSLGMLLLPVEMSLGPYIGHEIEANTDRHRWWIAFAGPAANILMALASYALFVFEPLPMLRVAAQAQLAVCAYSLLPIRPLDGEELERHKWVVVLIGAGLVSAGIGFTLGLI